MTLDAMWPAFGGEGSTDTKVPMCAQMMDDDYMLYVYKVRPCDRKGAHSWTECPFTHPGEKAARRCPKTHIYSADACPDARKSGKCARGDACPYSHGVFEQWLHPSRYRTQLCSFGTACRRPVCFFAHTVQELRVPTACGPAPAQAGAAQQAASLAAAAAAACQNPMLPGSMDLMLQQALLAQMQVPAHAQVDGATATLINRYQAASCAALANAAACQRQQQQHQAAAAAAAAAALAAAASNPAALMSMAQAAQAYQAAAAAAAAAAANVPFTSMGMPAPATSTPFAQAVSNSSGASSPTSASTNGSLAAFLNRQNSHSTVGTDPAGSADLGAHLLQQALLGAGSGTPSGMVGGPTSTHNGSCSPLLPWLPSASGAAAVNPFAGGYPSALMPATPAQSDSSLNSAATNANSAMSCGLDAFVPNFQRQLSMSVGLN